MLVLLLIFLLRLAAPAFSQMYDYGFNVDQYLSKSRIHSRDTTTPYVVGTLAHSRNRTAARQEIRRLEQDEDLWTLYMLGLNLMQYTDQSQLLSYYQIAGIHGVPWIEWNGVPATPGNENTGYCTHISILFLTWHRPYLALYEQVLYYLVQYIASLYTDNSTRERYERAAVNFRIPYMDWAVQPPSGKSVLPDSVGASSYINVTGPNGEQEIANPLYTYLFKPLNASMFIEDPYDLWLTTVRAPTANNQSAGSNNTLVALALNRNFQSIQQRLYNLFSNYDSYGNFSNEAWIPSSDSGKYDSLESLHDTIHSLTGLQGHMAWIPFSSFDPIFFLHHCMIDRVFALWQILYPNSWIKPTAATYNSFTTSAGQIQDSQTALTPFYAGENGTFWTSDAVRDFGVFGYTYDDMIDFPRSSLAETDSTTQARVKTLINQLYGKSSPAMLGIFGESDNDKATRMSAKAARRWTGPRQEARIERKVENTTSIQTSPPLPCNDPSQSMPRTIIADGQYWEWVINIHAEKQALGETFFVHMFLGDLPTDPKSWAYASNLVGTMGVFASPAKAMVDMGMSDTHASGTVPLTSALAQHVGNGELASLEPKVVEPYLRQNLKFAIATVGGDAVTAKDVRGLSIAVVSSVVQVPSGADELPRWGKAVDHFSLV